MVKKLKLLIVVLLLSTTLVACESKKSDKDISFDEKYNLLAEKIKGQNGEWPVFVISEPETINAKEIAENFVKSYDAEIGYAIIYIYESNKDVTNMVEMYKDSKYTLDIFNDSGSYTYELSNTNPYESIETGSLDI